MEYFKKTKICVAALSGKAYIANVDKVGEMTNRRRALEQNEVLEFIHMWAMSETRRIGSNEITIKSGNKKIVEIKLI